jgi:hypothetical protein
MFDRANLRNMVVLLAALLFAAFVPGQQEEVAGQPAPGLQEEMQSQLAAIDREVTRLRKAGKASNADQLAGQLQYFRDRLAGKAAVAGKEPELHVVGLY